MNEHTSQALSKRLQEKGFRAEHKSKWGTRKVDGKAKLVLSSIAYDLRKAYTFIPAYTFTELWAVVPDGIKGDYEIAMTKDITGTYVCYEEFSHGECISSTESFFHESPAEALGELVLWLIENGHLEVKHEGAN